MLCPGCRRNQAKTFAIKHKREGWEYCDECLKKQKPLERMWWLKLKNVNGVPKKPSAYLKSNPRVIKSTGSVNGRS